MKRWKLTGTLTLSSGRTIGVEVGLRGPSDLTADEAREVDGARLTLHDLTAGEEVEESDPRQNGHWIAQNVASAYLLLTGRLMNSRWDVTVSPDGTVTFLADGVVGDKPDTATLRASGDMGRRTATLEWWTKLGKTIGSAQCFAEMSGPRTSFPFDGIAHALLRGPPRLPRSS